MKIPSLGKRAEDNWFLWIIITIVLIFLFIFIFKDSAQAYIANRSNCPGECKASCDPGEFQQFSQCTKCGEKQAGVCCVPIKNYKKTAEQIKQECALIDAQRANGTRLNQTVNQDTSKQPPALEIRKGSDLVTKISSGSASSLESGKQYSYTVWGYGKDAKTCEITMLDGGQSTPTTAQGMSMQFSQDCTSNTASSKNPADTPATFNLNPVYDPAGNNAYKLQVLLKSSSGNIVASAIIYLNVALPVPAAQCPATCGEIVPVSNCAMVAARCNMQCGYNAGACVAAGF